MLTTNGIRYVRTGDTKIQYQRSTFCYHSVFPSGREVREITSSGGDSESSEEETRSNRRC